MEALRLARDIGWKQAEVEGLLGLSAVTAHPGHRAGDAAQAAEQAHAALGIARAAGYRLSEARALIALADCRADDAVERYREALAVCEQTGQRPDELHALRNLGRALYRTDPAGAREAWQRARKIAVEIGSTDCYFSLGR
jgi:tetratricopeptide (TPR) repeat protein